MDGIFYKKGPRKRKGSRAVSLETSTFNGKVDEEEEEDLKKSPESTGQRIGEKPRMCSKTESKRFPEEQAVYC